MPHPRLGRIGWILGGGGCRQGFPEAVQIGEFERAGIKADSSWAVSVGALNGLKPGEAAPIWERCFSDPDSIFDLHPDIKKALTRVFEATPRWRTPHLRSWHSFKDLREFLHECEIQRHNLLRLGRFGIRTIGSLLNILPSNQEKVPSFKEFVSSPKFIELLGRLKSLGFRLPQSFLDLTPLFGTLEKIIDFPGVLDAPHSLNMFARCGHEVHIFSTRPSISLITKQGSRVHRINSAANLLLAARAATAQRPLFDSVVIEGKSFSDAGSINPFPAEYAFDDGCDTVFAFVNDYSEPIPDTDIWHGYLGEVYAASRALFLQLHERAAARAEKEGRKLYLVTPQQPLHPDLQITWISPEAIEHTKRVEGEATRKFLQTLLA